MVLLATLAGLIFIGNPGGYAGAASYTFSQTNWSGGVSTSTAAHPTDESGWTKFSSSTSVNAAAAGITLSTSSLTYSETFSSTTYKDAANTTAGWTGNGQLEGSTDSAADLYSKLNGIFGGKTIYSIIAANGSIYAGSSAGKFAKYDPSSDTATDLTSKISSIFGSADIDSLVFDSVNGDVYIGGSSAKFAKYNIAGDSATSLAGKIWNSGTADSMVFATATQSIYMGSDGGKFYRYDVGTATGTDITAQISGFWSTTAIRSLGYDPVNAMVYVGGDSGKFARYNVGAATSTDMTSLISSSQGTNAIYAMAYDNVNQAIYWGGNAQTFGRWNIQTATSTNLVTKISSFWGSAVIKALTYDPSNQVVYLGGLSSKFGKYDIAANTASNLASSLTVAQNTYTLAYYSGSVYVGHSPATIEKYDTSSGTTSNLLRSGFSNIWFDTAINSLANDPINQAIYIGGAGATPNKFAKYDISTASTTNLASKEPWSGQTIFAETFDFTNQILYFSGSNGSFARYNPGTNASTDLSSSVTFLGAQTINVMVYDSVNQVVYMGAGGGAFGKYTIGGTGADLTSKISFWGSGAINSMTFDPENQAIYIGGASGKFAKYDIRTDTATDLTSSISSFWSTKTITSLAYATSGITYMGGTSGQLAKYTAATSTNLTSNISSIWSTSIVNALAYDPLNRDIYLGSNATKFAKISVDTNSVTDLTSKVSSYTLGGIYYNDLVYNSSVRALFLASSGFTQYNTACTSCNGVSLKVNANSQPVVSATLTKNDTPGTGSVTYYLSNDGGSNYSHVTAGQSYTFSTSGTDLRFKIVITGNATVQDISISYAYASASGNLISSAYNTGDPMSIIGGVSWTEDAALPSGTTATFSLRTSSSTDLLSAAAWTDFTDITSGCTNTSGSVACSGSALPAAMKTGGSNQYFQYKITLTSNSSSTPTITAASVTYVVNAPPQFNPDYPTVSAGGATAYQDATSSDPNFGKVVINYSIRDPDTLTGSNTPGYVTPSFEYNTGSGWTAIDPSYLSAGSTDNKAVDSTTYNTYSAVWDPKTEIPGVFSSSTRIRVTINDNEAANNTAQATTAVFSMDAKAPAVSSMTYDGVTGLLSLVASDDNDLQYRIYNDPANASTTAWTDSGALSFSTSTAWTTAGGTGAQKIYLDTKDSLGNTTTTTDVIPATPLNFDLRDTSNIGTSDWREFLSWKLYEATTSAAFSKYEVYRSTDGATYSLLANVTDANTNYYTDTAVTSSTLYYYKVTAVDTDGDRSAYSTPLSDTVDGQGGTDFTPPTISAVTVDSVQTTWAKITWTTDEISNSKVEYSVSPSKDYSLNGSNTALVTSHSLVITGLSPNTTYFFRVKSSDIFNNTATDDNGGNGYSFTTGGGPVISDVAVQSVNDKSATIVWNTDRDADSHITYATNVSDLAAGTNTLTAGSSDLVGGPPYQHSVNITAISGKTTYYYYVRSTAADSGYESIDNNNGSYYSFTTTYDTKAPVISAISTPIIAQTSASVVWTTDEMADSQVEWGTVSGSYPNILTKDATLSIYHISAITGLTADTKYYYHVKSADAAGNLATSAESSFTTAKNGTVVTVAGGSPPAPAKDTTPPTVADISVDEVNAFDATISFSTSKAAAVFVPFGDSPSYGNMGGSPEFESTHTVKLNRLRPGTTYHFKVQALDQNGNAGSSKDGTFTTKFVAENLDDLTKLDNVDQFQGQLEDLIQSTLPSLVPPVLSDISVSDISDDKATVSWTTNVKSYGSVALVNDDDFAAKGYGAEIGNSDSKTTSHSINLTNLSPGTLYHFQARSFSLPGVIGKSKDRTFTTSASKIEAQIMKTTNDSFTVAWKTPTDTTSYVEYRDLKTGRVDTAGSDDMGANHLVEIKNLVPATTYSVRVFGRDKNGITTEGAPIRVETRQDNTPPVISAISISNAFVPYRPNQLQTLISWTTDEPANSGVQYEEGVGVAEKLANSAGKEDEYVTQHTVILAAFKPGTVYRIKISSADPAGNKTETPVRTIITPASNESVFDVILKNFEDSFGFLKNINK